MSLSVLMPVYHKESPLFLFLALRSLQAQSKQADEIVIVKDGPIGLQLEATIALYSQTLPIRVLALARNQGLGRALRAGVSACRGELIARMDSDDICAPGRFALQASILADNRTVDAVGGAIAEFTTDPGEKGPLRRVPASSDEIVRYARSRNPVNHATAMFRRDAVLRAGNYQGFRDFEDYHLWVRMLMTGSRFVNLDEVLVYARAGDGMLGRRGGLMYAVREIAFQTFLVRSGFISPSQALGNSLLRLPLRLTPLALRRLVYRRFLRSAPSFAPGPAPVEVPCTTETRSSWS